MAAVAATSLAAAATGARNVSTSTSLRCNVSRGLSCCSRAAFLPCLSLRSGGGRGSAHAARRLKPFLVAQRAAQAEAKEEEEEEEEEEAGKEDVDVPQPLNSAEVSNAVVENLVKDLKEAWAADDEDAVSDLEGQLRLIEEQRDSLHLQVATLTEDISQANQRFLRLNADFDNYRKRSEREKASLSDTGKVNVIESLLPMIDNFERAKGAIKTETEAEQKIDNSYQGIYKQFVEAMRSLGVSVVETVGKEFDPQVHEAIMREESAEYAEGIVIQEFRRGFQIGEKLVRPAMVKVSSGPPSSPASTPAAPAPSTEEDAADVVQEKVE